MSNTEKINKSLVEGAKADFEEIKKFAIENASKELEEKVTKKIINMLNESASEKENIEENILITIDTDGNNEVDVKKDDEVVDGVSSIESNIDDEDDEFIVDDGEDEIYIDNDEEELKEEDAVATEQMPADTATQDATQDVTQDTTNTDTTMEQDNNAIANPFQAVMDKLDDLANMISGGENTGASDDIEVIDDETQVDPNAPQNTAPPAQDAAPVNEDEMDDDIVFEIVDTIEDEDIFEIDTMEEDEVDESLSFSVENQAGKRLNHRPIEGGKGDGSHAPVGHRSQAALKENAKKIAQKESELDELKQENVSLKKQLNELSSEVEEYQDSFVQLKEQFDEMQTFNAKLSLAYQVAMLEGLSTSEKVVLAEEFDKAETVKEAEKIFDKVVKEIVKENKNNDIKASEKIKATPTKAIISKSQSEPLYESKEVKRMKELAGIKNLEN